MEVNPKFNAEKISQTARFVAKGEMNEVFPLFGPWDERKWVDGWDPQPIYPVKEVFQEGVTFKTKGGFDNEPEYFWRLAKIDRANHAVQYIVTTSNRQWSIDVSCENRGDHTTGVEVTYAYVPFNDKGAVYNRQALDGMYANNLTDWEEMINHFLETGQTLKH